MYDVLLWNIIVTKPRPICPSLLSSLTSAAIGYPSRPPPRLYPKSLVYLFSHSYITKPRRLLEGVRPLISRFAVIQIPPHSSRSPRLPSYHPSLSLISQCRDWASSPVSDYEHHYIEARASLDQQVCECRTLATFASRRFPVWALKGTVFDRYVLRAALVLVLGVFHPWDSPSPQEVPKAYLSCSQSNHEGGLLLLHLLMLLHDSCSQLRLRPSEAFCCESLYLNPFISVPSSSSDKSRVLFLLSLGVSPPSSSRPSRGGLPYIISPCAGMVSRVLFLHLIRSSSSPEARCGRWAMSLVLPSILFLVLACSSRYAALEWSSLCRGLVALLPVQPRGLQ